MVSLYNNWIISYREVIQTKLHTGKINPSALHSFFNFLKKVFSTLFVIFETFFTYRATWFYFSSRDVFSLTSDSFFFTWSRDAIACWKCPFTCFSRDLIMIYGMCDWTPCDWTSSFGWTADEMYSFLGESTIVVPLSSEKMTFYLFFIFKLF